MTIRTVHVRLIVLALVVGCGALWVSTRVRAQVAPPDPERHNFGMVGFTRGETVRLNVVYVPGLGDAPPDPCRVQLMFFNGDGRRIAASDVSLMPGQARFLDIANDRRASGSGRPGEIAPPDPDRQQVRAGWQAPPDPDMPQCTSDHFIATVEVFGRDGSTTVLYPGLQAPPEPDLPAGR